MTVNCSDEKMTVPNRPCSEVGSPVRISCSVVSNPPSKILWTTKPGGCREAQSDYCHVGEEGAPSVCVSALENLCEGSYACEVKYNDTFRMKTIPGVIVKVNGNGGCLGE